MRGRLPNSPRLHVMEGKPGNRAVKKGAQPEKKTLVAPPPPTTLTDKVAREAWVSLAQKLTEKGVLTEWDHDAFAAYCTAKSDWIRYRTALEKMPIEEWVMKTPNGGKQQHPLVGMANKAEREMTRLGEHFGLTPMIRDRGAVHGKPDDGEAEDDPILTRRSS